MKMRYNKVWRIVVMMLIFGMILAGCAKSIEADEASTENPITSETAATTETATTEAQSSVIDQPLVLRSIVPEGATTIAMLKMIYENTELIPNVTVEYESLVATDMIAAELMGEKADFAIVPTNLAIALYNKGVPYQFASINTHGNLYMITSLDISTWEDLKGKDVYMIGQGLVPDLIFRYLAAANGLDPDVDMNIIYLAGTTEVAPTFLAGKSSITIMPEPVLSIVSTKDVPYKLLFDFQSEFEKASGQTGGFPQAGLMVRNTISQAYPDVVNAYIERLEESCTWVNENSLKAGEYATELEISTPAPIIVKSMKGLNIWHDDAYLHKAELESLFEILLNASPDSIGGKMPDEGFYYKK